jgi:hypothetical protein
MIEDLVPGRDKGFQSEMCLSSPWISLSISSLSPPLSMPGSEDSLLVLLASVVYWSPVMPATPSLRTCSNAMIEDLVPGRDKGFQSEMCLSSPWISLSISSLVLLASVVYWSPVMPATPSLRT